MKRLSESDLPALYRAADAASKSAQSWFIRIVGFDLALVVVAAILSSISTNDVSAKFRLIVGCSVASTVGLILTIALKTRLFERNWYDGRAIAESIKTRSWRFMMRTEPYDIDDADAHALFLRNLKELLAERDRLGHTLVSDGGSTVTAAMVSIRQELFEKRKALYLDERLKDQKIWYSDKSRSNRRWGNFIFVLILAAQSGILFSSFYLLADPQARIHLISIFSAAAAAFIGWLQLKRHQELTNSYALAAQELSFIAEEFETVGDEQQMSQFILDAENAISREHTLWIARRDKV